MVVTTGVGTSRLNASGRKSNWLLMTSNSSARSKHRRDVQGLVHLGVDGRVLLVPGGCLCVESRRRPRVGGREQRDVVAARDEALRQGRRDLLPRAVGARRHAVGDRGEHGDPDEVLRPIALKVQGF